LPSLRDRAQDIPVLANYFLSQFCNKEDKHLQTGKEALSLLQQHLWKGNTRELRNVLERASILAEGSEILPEHLPYEIQKQDSTNADNLSLVSVERNHIQKVLQHTNGNKTKTAEYLGIGLTTLYRKMEEYHIPR
jgi:DNA-binding NtrC family response regulator